jgi:carbon-monoxide dehydrogenase medium subunit
MLQLYEGVKKVDVLVDISGIPEMRMIEKKEETIHIGASLTYSEIIGSRLIRTHAPLLVEASQMIGAAQIRNMGTIGGNIANASPAGDILPCLYVLESDILISGLLGERLVQVNDFFIGYRQTSLKPGEIIKGISFRSMARNTGSAFLKFGLRQSMAISVVSVASSIQVLQNEIINASVALGAVAPTVVRSPSAERILIGQVPSLELFIKAGESAQADICPIDDVRGSAEFREYLTKILVKQALEKAWKRACNSE